jgi:hypothetical protein
MYFVFSGNIFNSLKYSLHESLSLILTIILKVPFLQSEDCISVTRIFSQVLVHKS